MPDWALSNVRQTASSPPQIVFSITVTADSIDAPALIDLSSYGPIDDVLLDTEPLDPSTGSRDFFGAQYDDFAFCRLRAQDAG